MNRIRNTLLCLAALLLILWGASASAEATITFSPEAPKKGEYVDVTVTPDRPGAQGIRYKLSVGSDTVFEGKEESKHYTASFRPRQEGTYTLTATIVYGKKDTETVSVPTPMLLKASPMEPDTPDTVEISVMTASPLATSATQIT